MYTHVYMYEGEREGSEESKGRGRGGLVWYSGQIPS